MNNEEQALDQVLAEIREEPIDTTRQRSASERVWQRLQQERALEDKACENFRAQLDDYVSGQISMERRMLLKDHLTGCGPCRKELERKRKPPVMFEPTPMPPKSNRMPVLMGLAAVILVGILVGTQMLAPNTSGSASLLSGNLITLDGERRALTEGEQIPVATSLRSPRGAMTELDFDQTRIEIRELSEFKLAELPQGLEIQVEKGQLIVNHQGNQKIVLVGETVTAAVAAKTLMTFNQNERGTRVGVIDGHVQIDHDGARSQLVSGDAFSDKTADKFGKTLLVDFAWSQYADRYADMIINQTETKTQRTSPLIPLMDPNTMAFASVPANTFELENGVTQFETFLESNQVMNFWWNNEISQGTTGHVKAQLHFLNKVSEQLQGMVTISIDDRYDGTNFGVMLLAEFKDGTPQLMPVIEEVNRNPISRFEMVLAHDLRVPTHDDAIYVWHNDEILVLANSLFELQNLMMRLDQGSQPFLDTVLGQAAQQSSAKGTNIGVDLHKIIEMTPEYRVHLEELGFADASHMFLREQVLPNHRIGEAELVFNAERKGMASWLTSPAPMDAIDFFSPDTILMSAFTVKEPTKMFDDLTGLSTLGESNILNDINELEDETGLSLRNDLMTSLGDEAAMAVDGPIFPIPAWKLVLETTETVNLQETFHKLVTYLDEQLEASLRLDMHEDDGLLYYTVKDEDRTHLAYTYADGYLLICANVQLLKNTMNQRRAGIHLGNDQAFRDLLPHHGEPIVSGLFYENLAQLGMLASAFGVDPDAGPGLATAIADRDSITFSSISRNDPMSLGLFQLLSGAKAVPSSN